MAGRNLDIKGSGCYHIVSRIVDRKCRIDDQEKKVFYGIMRQVEAFCGVKIVAYAIMSNHFHILLNTYEQCELSDSALKNRMLALYDSDLVEANLQRWSQAKKAGDEGLVKKERSALVKRMCLSGFVKNLKERYAASYNSRHGRRGRLWEGLYECVMVENYSQARAVVAAYIDLNPVRAGLVVDPADFLWSSYGASIAGDEKSRVGLSSLYSDNAEETKWMDTLVQYKKLLGVGSDVLDAEKQNDSGIYQKLENGDQLGLPDILRCRVRYFTGGLVVGRAEFINKTIAENPKAFKTERKSKAQKMRFADWGDLRVLRNLRVDAVTIPKRE